MIIHWQFDPVAFQLGSLVVHWYGLAWLVAFLSGRWLVTFMSRRDGNTGLDAAPLMAYALIGAIVGARLGHCLFYHPAYYLSNPIEILRIWNGGLASHGGAIGLLVGLYLGKHLWRSTGALQLFDYVAVAAALGSVFIRVANFLNSEIIGIPTSGNWGVIFTEIDQIARHPVQLYEASAYLLVFIFLFSLFMQPQKPQAGAIFGWWLILVFSARFILEFWKADLNLLDSALAISTGQLLSIPFVILGIFMQVGKVPDRLKDRLGANQL